MPPPLTNLPPVSPDAAMFGAALTVEKPAYLLTDEAAIAKLREVFTPADTATGENITSAVMNLFTNYREYYEHTTEEAFTKAFFNWKATLDNLTPADAPGENGIITALPDRSRWNADEWDAEAGRMVGIAHDWVKRGKKGKARYFTGLARKCWANSDAILTECSDETTETVEAHSPQIGDHDA